MMDYEYIYDTLGIMFPNASCELNYNNEFEFLCAVLLSAQTTDKAVNKITPALFKKYPNAFEMARAEFNELEEIIRPIGLSKNKARYLISLAKELTLNYDGLIPKERRLIETLPGVGRKTCNVFLAEIYKIPQVAVDTHVERTSKRIGLVDESLSVKATEEKLKELYNESYWISLHHRLLFLGRYICKSKKPECGVCLLNKTCKSAFKI